MKKWIGISWILFAWHGILLAQMAEGEMDIRGAKPPVEIPEVRESNPWVWIALVMVVLLTAGLWYFLKRRSGKSSEPGAGEIALRDLRELERAGDGVDAEEFARRAADSVRKYVERRFGIAAPRRSTEEFLQEVGVDGKLEGFGGAELRRFMRACDMAKYGAAGIPGKERTGLLGAAKEFVTATARNDGKEPG